MLKTWFLFCHYGLFWQINGKNKIIFKLNLTHLKCTKCEYFLNPMCFFLWKKERAGLSIHTSHRLEWSVCVQRWYSSFRNYIRGFCSFEGSYLQLLTVSSSISYVAYQLLHDLLTLINSCCVCACVLISRCTLFISCLEQEKQIFLSFRCIEEDHLHASPAV